MSEPRSTMNPMTPEQLLAFEHAHPADTPTKRVAILRDLRLDETRYYTLLHRAAESLDGIRAHPITARLVRERAQRRAAEREGRAA